MYLGYYLKKMTVFTKPHKSDVIQRFTFPRSILNQICKIYINFLMYQVD